MLAARDTGAFGWISTLTSKERSAFGACVGGWALDAMDVQMYSFVIPTLIATWGITRGEAGALGTAALLASAVGGWVAGWVADRYGRVRTLQLAIAWFAVFTCLSGVAQNYQQLFLVRALLGVGFGGEWAAGAVLLGEVMRARASRQSPGRDAGGLGSRLGSSGAALRPVLFHHARRDCLARFVPDRHLARGAGVLRAPLRRGAGGLPEVARRDGSERR